MQSEFEAIDELRSGALMLIITLVLVLIATITVLAYFALESKFLIPFVSNLHISQLSSYFGDILAITFIGALLAIPGYWNLREGFKTLADLGYTGATLFFISLGLIIPAEIIVYFSLTIISMLTSSTGAYSVLLGSLVVALIGWILQIISNTLVGIGFFKVGDSYNKSITKLGGILMIIGAALSFLIPLIAAVIFLVSLALIYVDLRQIGPIKPSALTQTYQVGQGVIRSDGLAFITLYTSTQATITSVKVEGIAMNAVMINPVVLLPGQNGIVIKFDNVSQLTPGASYLITLTLNVGENLIEVKAIAIYQP